MNVNLQPAPNTEPTAELPIPGPSSMSPVCRIQLEQPTEEPLRQMPNAWTGLEAGAQNTSAAWVETLDVIDSAYTETDRFTVWLGDNEVDRPLGALREIINLFVTAAPTADNDVLQRIRTLLDDCESTATQVTSAPEPTKTVPSPWLVDVYRNGKHMKVDVSSMLDPTPLGDI